MANEVYSRRGFIGIGVCGAAAGLLTGAGLAGCRVDASQRQAFARVALVDAEGEPLSSAGLVAGREYLFFYPYVCTPCFLLNLGKPTQPVELTTASGEPYRWPGGVGAAGAVVAFAAICSHKLTHLSAQVSFIGYRTQPVGYLDENNNVVRRAEVIQCCSEHSIYDPAAGARVLAGPAPQPLASIALEEADGQLFATGVYGGLVYERFFERFGFRLALEFGEPMRQPVTDSARVVALADYTRNRIQC